MSILHQLYVVRIFSAEALKLQNFQTCVTQFSRVSGLALQTGHGERLAQRHYVFVILFSRQSIACHPVHCYDLARRLENPACLPKKFAPVIVMACALDIDYNVDRVIGKWQVQGAIGILKIDPAFQTRVGCFPSSYLQLHTVNVDARNAATGGSRKMDGRPSNSASRIQYMMAFVDNRRLDDDIDHARHGARQAFRIREDFTGAGALARLEQSEMYMVAVPPSKSLTRNSINVDKALRAFV